MRVIAPVTIDALRRLSGFMRAISPKARKLSNVATCFEQSLTEDTMIFCFSSFEMSFPVETERKFRNASELGCKY